MVYKDCVIFYYLSFLDHNNTSQRFYFPNHKLENISSLTSYAVPPDFSSIKLILSEGWLQTRENMRPLFKRVRNIVCFMFQYAEPGTHIKISNIF